jgi:copper homeostasis protein CutC
MNPYATSLALYLTTLLFSFLLRTKTHFDPTEKILPGAGVTDENTSHFLSECNSALIASFHLIQSECLMHSERLMHSAMILGSGSS